MAITEQTRTQLIGLSVAMLGQAPGTARLNDWAGMVGEDGMSAEDLANHIAESDAFVARYPIFQTSEDFAKEFLGDVLHGVSEGTMNEAVALVTSMLNDGMGRGSLVLAVVDFLHDVAMKGMDHDGYGEFGMSAMAMANKVEVASHYTITARMANPNAEVLASVTADADTAAMAIDAIDNPPVAPSSEEGETFLLTAARDSIVGTEFDDKIYSEPAGLTINGGAGPTLNPYDIVDGAGGYDTLFVYSSGEANHFPDQVSNVEKVVINAQSNAMANMLKWDGLESVEVERFIGDVSVSVNGAEVVLGNSASGSATVIGAGGDLSVSGGKSSAITVGTLGHTTSVMTGGGKSVTINNNGARGQSESVTQVAIDGVQRDLGDDNARGGDEADMDSASVKIHSNVIETLSLSNNDAIVAVVNASEEPGDLAVTVNKYGGYKVTEASGNRVDAVGKLCLTDGSTGNTVTPENISINVEGTSEFGLAGNMIKTISVSGEAGLKLDVTKFDGSASNTLQSITVSEGAGLTIDASGSASMTMVDASASSGKNSFTLKATDKLVSVMGGSGNDTVDISDTNGTLSIDGLMVDLGAGDDTYVAGASKNQHSAAQNSSIMGGDGTDTLKMTNDDFAITYRDGGSTKSIYSGFEILDVGGSAAGSYNIARLGVEHVKASGGTDDGATVVLTSVAPGTGITVSGNGRADQNEIDGPPDENNDPTDIVTDSKAGINYMLAPPGFGAVALSHNLDVDLVAMGNAGDRRKTSSQEKVISDGTQVALTLTADANISELTIDSSASLHSRATTRTGDYENTLMVTAGAAVRLAIMGDARADVGSAADDGSGLAKVQVVDARANTAGVDVDVRAAEGGTTSFGPRVNLLGSEGGDTFIGSQTAGNTLMGNGGADKLYGGVEVDIYIGGAGADTMGGFVDGGRQDGGNDTFRYYAASDSQLSFGSSGRTQGHDTILGFESGEVGDKISLFRGLTEHANNSVLDNEYAIDTTADTGDDAQGAIKSLESLLVSKASGFFETTSGVEVTRHFIAIVNETADLSDTIVDDTGSWTWVFFDLNGSGDFEQGSDLVIRLLGGDFTFDSANDLATHTS